MSVDLKELTLGALLEETQKKIFFENFTDMKSPFMSFMWPEPPREIPAEIRCIECAGSGKLITVGPIEDCSKCQGKGIPPIPITEFLDPKRPLKGQK